MELLDAIRANNFETFTKLTGEKLEKFNRFNLDLRVALFQATITYDSKDIFQYILPTGTAEDIDLLLRRLDFGATNLDPFFIYALFETGASLDSLNSSNFPGLNGTDLKFVKYFLDKGLDPNFTNENEDALLLLILRECIHKRKYDPSMDEIVAMLLYHGADPSETIKCRHHRCNYNAFELVCTTQISDFIFDQLFLYTFDEKNKSGVMHLGTFLELTGRKKCQRKSRCCTDTRTVRIRELFGYDLQFVVEETEDREIFLNCLLFMDCECLDVSVSKHLSAVHAIFEEANFPSQISKAFYEKFIPRMEFLISKSDFYLNCVVNFFENLDAYRVCQSLIYDLECELNLTKFILFMVKFGLKCNTGVLHMIYQTYGYCVLFRTLLHLPLDPEETPLEAINRNVMVSLITDINLNIQTVIDSIVQKHWVSHPLDKRFIPCLKTPFGLLTMYDLSDLLDFYAHPKLIDFLSHRYYLPFGLLQKIRVLPSVPSLQELARDSCRRHLVERFTVKSAREFYDLVNALPICPLFVKIITLERKLYYVEVPREDFLQWRSGCGRVAVLME